MATAAVIGGATIIAAKIQSDAASKASSQQSDAATEAARLQAGSSARALTAQQEQFAATKETLDPFISGGVPAFEQQQALSGSLGAEAQQAAFDQFIESPGQSFLREQGLRGISRGAAARGGLGGANRLKSLTQFSQGLAQQDFQNQFNRLGAVTGVGLQAAQALGGVGSASAAGQANIIQRGGLAQAQGVLGAGRAQAAGTLGRANAFTSGLSGLSNIALLNQQGLLGSPTPQQQRVQAFRSNTLGGR